MTDVTPFDFQGNSVRVVTIDSDPWFVAPDASRSLGYSNPRDAIVRYVDAEDRRDGVEIPDAIGRSQPTTVINESGLYALIFSSKLPAAKDFKRWVTSKVLPQIRKTGSYAVAPMDPLDQAQMMLDAMRANRDRLARLEGTTYALTQSQHHMLKAVEGVSARQSAQDGEHNWFTTLAYAKLNDLPTDRVSCQRHGQRASSLMRSRGQEPHKRQDATFGTINVYPVDVLDETAE